MFLKWEFTLTPCSGLRLMLENQNWKTGVRAQFPELVI
jgi:hypothetical protein